MAGELALESLRIRGFRGFDELTIPRLGRVNLFVGRNAAGKSTVLEAIELWSAGPRSAIPVLGRILAARHELPPLTAAPDAQFAVHWGRAFFDRGPKRTRTRFEIGVAGEGGHLCVTLRRGAWVRDPEGTSRFQLVDAAEGQAGDTEFALLAEWEGERRVHRLTAERPMAQEGALRSYVSIPVGGMPPDLASAEWDRILLSDESQSVIDAIRLIDPEVERLSFLERSDREAAGPGALHGRRLPLVKRRGRPAEPLMSLGGGAIRLLDLALGLVGARGGALLVDEIENGVHYEVLPDLWRQIFRLASELDAQVFAATHSGDCIRAFQMAAAAHASEGVLVRLERDAHGSRAKCFDEASLATITDARIEVR